MGMIGPERLLIPTGLHHVLNGIFRTTAIGGGLIDYFIWGVFQPGSHWYRVIVVGISFMFIYYFVFKTYLTKKNLSIEAAEEAPVPKPKAAAPQKSQLLAPVGGRVLPMSEAGGLSDVILIVLEGDEELPAEYVTGVTAEAGRTPVTKPG